MFRVVDEQEQEIGSFTTDLNGEAMIEFTSAGTYTMTETAPIGYTADPGTWTIEVSRSGVDKVEYNNSKSVWQWFYHLFFAEQADYRDGVLHVANAPEMIDVSATKIWDDQNNQDGKRAEVTFRLYRQIGDDETVEIMCRRQ